MKRGYLVLESETQSNVEAVSSNATTLRTPSVWRRLTANFIDGFVAGLPWLFFLKELIMTKEVHVPWIIFACLIVFGNGYQIYFYKTYKATIGKMLLGLELCSVRPDQPTLSWSQACIRVLGGSAAGVITNLLPYPSAFLNPERRHLMDLAAGTRVIEKKGAPRNFKVRPVLGWSLIVIFALMTLSKGIKFLLPKDEVAARSSEAVLYDREGVHFKWPSRPPL
jgi:uncharacterized RDD family membrane protein YckC